MTKRNDLEREVLMAGSGFCKKLSIKGLYAESVIWKYLRELGGQLVINAPVDKSGKKTWPPQYILNDIRYKCIKIIHCRDLEELELLFSITCSNFNFGIITKCLDALSTNILLTWAALKYVKNPTPNAKRFIRGLENVFFYNRVREWYEINGLLLSSEESAACHQYFEIMYTKFELLKQKIEQDKARNIHLKIEPELANPQDICENWTRVTDNFNVDRIGEILTLWKKKGERVAVLKAIKKDCEACQILSEDMRIRKVVFLDEFIRAIKKDTCVSLLCHLQELNMQYECRFKTLQGDIEKMNIDYISKNNEMEGKVAELDLQVKEQSKTIQRQDEYINFLQSTNKERKCKTRVFCLYVTFPENAEYIMKRLHELIDIQTSPKQIVMPLRTAVDAGVITRRPWGDFCAEFGNTKLKSSTSYSDYLNEKYKYTDEAFNLLVEEFAGLRNLS